MVYRIQVIISVYINIGGFCKLELFGKEIVIYTSCTACSCQDNDKDNNPYNSTLLFIHLSHCLGFVGIDNQGLLGLELEYDSFLKGKNGSIDYYMDAKSHNLKMYPSHYTYSQSGMNITLTIDKRVQDVIERELSNAYDMYHPDGIWALAMNPKNGEILGIASYPNFNPNDYQNEDKGKYGIG